MPFDACFTPTSEHAIIDQPRSKRLEVALRLGVFRFEGQWKVYSNQGRASVHPSRELAVSVAETLAVDAARSGRRVELFVEDDAGGLRQAAVGLH